MSLYVIGHVRKCLSLQVMPLMKIQKTSSSSSEAVFLVARRLTLSDVLPSVFPPSLDES